LDGYKEIIIERAEIIKRDSGLRKTYKEIIIERAEIIKRDSGLRKTYKGDR
jgi:hypothetical protein